MSEPMGISCQAAETMFDWHEVPREDRLELYENIMICWNEELRMASQKKNKKAGF